MTLNIRRQHHRAVPRMKDRPDLERFLREFVRDVQNDLADLAREVNKVTGKKSGNG